jgi:transcriptional regulator with GAF, ATPase, and Fis domain
VDIDLVSSEEPAPRTRTAPHTHHGSYREALQSFERELILDALSRAQGVQKKAAALLGLKPTTLNEKIKRLGLREP